MNMTSHCDVTNSENQIQMAAMYHWMKPPQENFLRTPLLCSNLDNENSYVGHVVHAGRIWPTGRRFPTPVLGKNILNEK